MSAVLTRRAALVALPAVAIAAGTGTATACPPSDAELLRLADKLARLQPICEELEVARHAVHEAWKRLPDRLSLETPAGLEQYERHCGTADEAADGAWLERDAISDRVRETPAQSLHGLLAKARALRFELYPDLGDDMTDSWAWDCINGFVAEIERLAGDHAHG